MVVVLEHVPEHGRTGRQDQLVSEHLFALKPTFKKMTKEAFKERANWSKFLIKKVGVLDVDLDPALWKVMPPQLSLALTLCSPTDGLARIFFIFLVNA